MWPKDTQQPTLAEIEALHTGHCRTVQVDKGAEVYVSGPYQSGDPFLVRMVVYDWSPSGPVAIDARTPSEALERMLEMVDCCMRRPMVITERLIELMTTDGDVASEQHGAGKIMVGRVGGGLLVALVKGYEMTEAERAAVLGVASPQSAFNAVMALRRGL